MYAIKTLLFVTVTVKLLSAQAPAIQGTVQQETTKQPLATAELRFHKAGQFELAADIDTDRQGRFRIESLPPGDYTLDVSKPNFLPAQIPLRLPLAGPLDIRLTKFAAISGRVADDRDQPVPGRIPGPGGRTSGYARILLFAANPTSGQQPYFKQAITDQNGCFHMAEIPPGDYTLGLWYAGQKAGAGMRLFPDTAHPRSFTVTGGEDIRDINFTLANTPTFHVAGKLALPDPKTRISLALGLPDHPGAPIATTLTEPDGSFLFDKIPPGAYNLYAAGPEGGYGTFENILRGNPHFGRTGISLAGDLDGVTLDLAPARTLKVQLHSAQTPNPDCPQSASVYVAYLEPWGVAPSTTGSATFAKPTDIGDLPPGKLRFGLSGLGDTCYLVQSGVVDAATETSTVLLELAPAGKIEGRAAATVTLQNQTLIRLATPSPEGTFHFNNLPPGDYTLNKTTVVKVTGGKTTMIDLTRGAAK